MREIVGSNVCSLSIVGSSVERGPEVGASLGVDVLQVLIEGLHLGDDGERDLAEGTTVHVGAPVIVKGLTGTGMHILIVPKTP